MPTYEYKCRDCGHQLEVVQSFSDDALTKCPSCRKKALRKVFSPVGIAFKGSGFYKTDSRSSNGKSSSTAASSTEKADKADKSSASSDAKSSSTSSSDGNSSSSSSDKKSTSSSSDKKATIKK
ncbi:MAG TPA: zinc ribbon domain-containing protein [Acidimicrobiales bacterium]